MMPTQESIRRILVAARFVEAYPARTYVTAGFQIGEHNGVPWITYYGGSGGGDHTAERIKQHALYVKVLESHFAIEHLHAGTKDDTLNVRAYASDHYRKLASELRTKVEKLTAEAAAYEARAIKSERSGS